MVAYPRTPNLTRWLPTGGGIAAGLGAAATVALMPNDLLERLVWTSGVAALVPAAAPPLGMTARALLTLGAGVMAGAVAWAALYLLWGPGGFLAGREAKGGLSVRRADAHPDAPPRRPMTAADLGTPLMDVPARPPVEQPLPADLDQPLAAFDFAALPASVRAPAPIAGMSSAPLAPGERIKTFDLAPPPATTPAPLPIRREGGPAPSIDALLRRLEEGAGRLAART